MEAFGTRHTAGEWRFRIAPTPSGFLHEGNAFNFILTALLAHQAGASLRLRIDDADSTRARPEFTSDIFDTLQWLGLEWDEGPRDAADHTAHFSQSLRTSRYDHLIAVLVATDAVFACECSRKEILAAGSTNGQYPGTCRAKGLPLDAPDTALRLHTPDSATVRFNDALLGHVSLTVGTISRDPVIRRRDGHPAYHIASLADDLEFSITHIVRGEDLLASTATQLFISQTLGGTEFGRAQFYHHPLLKDNAGEKLSKSAGSNSLRAMQDAGADAADVYRRFSAWMKWPVAPAGFIAATKLFARYSCEALKRTTRRASGE